MSSQSRLILNNNSFVVIENSANLVLENPDPNAITITGTGGNIISEGETNQVVWMIGENTGTYTVPFTTMSAVSGGNETKIPVVIELNSPGMENTQGKLLLSTYETSDNNTPWPSDVTHMNNDLGSDNSLNVVDRFWKIEPVDYTQKPEGKMTLYFDPASNETGGTNTLDVNNLQAQRFNATNNQWGDYASGVLNLAQQRMENIFLTDANFFGTWTLVDAGEPLPIEMVNFEVVCAGNGKIQWNWETASEINNDHFELQSSGDGINWVTIAEVKGAGNSNTLLAYKYLFSGTIGSDNFYRIKQVDFNGEFSVSNSLQLYCLDGTDQSITVFPNPFNDQLHLNFSDLNDDTEYEIFNAIGQTVLSGKVTSQQEMINFDHLADGQYFLNIYTPNQIHHFKLIKQ